MDIKLYLLTFFIAYTLRAGIRIVAEDETAGKKKIVNFCFNASLEGYRLNVTVLTTAVAPDWLGCVIECVKEPCCRSINFKNTLKLRKEPNCEMLHNVVYNDSQKFLEANCSYNHVFLNNPQKEYNKSCFPQPKSFNLKDHVFESEILKNESLEFSRKLGEWLNKPGNWSVCWRSTRDGMKPEAFHAGCDEKLATLIIVKVVKNNKSLVFGGYATKSWAGVEGSPAPGSFLFSLRNNDGLLPFKASLKDENSPHAIYCNPTYGPLFGGDVMLMTPVPNGLENSCKDFGRVYQAPTGYDHDETKTKSLLAGSLFFTPTEVEVLSLN